MTLRSRCRSGIVYLATFTALLAPAARLRADDEESREFTVFVDGKDAGKSHMKLIQKADGTSYVSSTVDVKFRHLLVIDYTLKIDTQEWWKDGKLIGLKTACIDNGKKTDVTVAVDGKQLRLRVNGQERQVQPDLWTTSFWKLADSRYHNKQIGILEVDTGKEFNCELKYMGADKLKVGGDFQECYHFRVSAAPGPVDLWYDRYHRMVRQEFTESGHKTIVQLIKISR